MPDQQIKVGDIVYQRKSGWSGVPMKVLELMTVDTPNGSVAQALCRGARGWGVAGLFSLEHKAYVERFALNNLTHTSNCYGGEHVDTD